MAELTRIHTADSPSAISVVFIHGLGGDAHQTWMCKPKDPATLWPKWVGEDADCNVWILGYDAAFSGWTEHAMHLADQGNAFMSELLSEPSLLGRPLVLVGHSLGGLVIKSGMVHAETLDDPRFQPLLEAISGVVFVGTPHQGSNLASVAAVLSGLLRTNPQVVNMASDDAWLKIINGQFRKLQANREFYVSAFSETKGVFLGWKFLGMSIGSRVIIVNRNSSDPQIPQVVPTQIDADHIQIAKPANRNATIHKTMLALIANLKGKSLSLPTKEAELGPVPGIGDLRLKLYEASTPLLTWPCTLPGGEWLERPELEQLVQRIDGASSSLTLVLGEPGSGKSALLARVAKMKHAEGWSVLAIKADRLPEDILNSEGLARYLNIGTAPANALRGLAQAGPVLVVIDQLDALADLVVQHSARLRVLIDLIRDLSEVPNVHTLSSCRSFEQRHDPSLRNLDATVVTLNLPEWSVVQAVLTTRGIKAEGWNDDLKQILRSPHALDVFLGLLQTTTEVGVLRSFQGMLQLQWEQRVLSDPTGRRKRAMLELACTMAEREVLGLPLAAAEDWFSEIQELSAAGLLRFDEGAGRVEFRHQTLYEFVRARSFLDEAGSLTDTVLRHQKSLRIRPQLWHALAFFRKTSPEDYSAELVRLWSAGIRPHLKMLVIEFLGRQVSPLPAELQLVYQSLDDRWFRPRFLGAAIGSPGWLSALAERHLPIWMALPVEEALGLVPLLETALSVDPQLVTDLVRKIWLSERSKDELSWRVLGMGSVAPQSPEWVGDLEAIALRAPLDEWTIGHVAGVVSEVLPNEAPRLVAAWLRRKLQQAEADLTRIQESDADQPTAVRDRVEALIKASQFHGLPAIAEAAPQAFVNTVWPIYSEILTMCAGDEHAIVVGFRHSAGLTVDDMDDEDERTDRPLLEAMRIAVQGWAKADSGGFFEFVDSHSASELMVAERLLAKGVTECAAALPAKVLAYLKGDPRRLVLGTYSNVHKESVALISALSPHLDAQQFAELEEFITSWQRYREQPEGEDASIRMHRLRWTRQHRLRLLRALPKERCAAALQRQIEEEERAFPDLGNEDVRSSGCQFIGSPVTANQMANSKDEDVLNLFNELSDESAWDHPRHWMKGGAIQAGRGLAALAKRDIDKVLRVIRALKPGINEIPVAIVLRELEPSGYRATDLFALIEELDGKGFESEGFRQSAAHAVESAITSKSPAPEFLMTRLEAWLTAVGSWEEQAAETADASKNESVLWGYGGFNALPSGNFPILAALTKACLITEPAQTDRWLEILEKNNKKAESPKVWQAMMGHYLPHLHLANRARAEVFLETLFDAHPTLISTREAVHLIANAYRWASAVYVQRWLQRLEQSAQNEQAFGELALLRHSMFPAEAWARDIVVTALSSKDERMRVRRTGIAHAVAHLWANSMVRPVVHPYLLHLTTSAEDAVLKAVDAIFLGNGFVPDLETRQLLDALVANNRLLTQPHAERFPETLEGLVAFEPERVCLVANTILDALGEQMGNISTSWYQGTEWLLAIALSLQDLGEAHRDSGSALFERMLEFNLPQARNMTLDLDKRTPTEGWSRPPVRRRSARKTIKQ
ncbi:hypothetical protein [Rhodanobacter sp. T12-5]|uniref:hypothetical protein n=1 Tax=Rhodanobacter sp. T12-5 TaxID=2024611 RepID=UPI0011EF9AEB|nr:hypothetical protein [Rhodanobacter sp. T12-5]KAA0069048.1 hypothetical protein CIW53_12990 [Rhodanobacter sp. T12-5]